MNDDFLWVEKYRPKTVEQTILQKQLKDTFTKIVESGEIPNMLFTGSAGLGKTTVAKAICEQLELDYIVINGSEDCLLYTSPSPRDRTRSRMPSSA